MQHFQQRKREEFRRKMALQEQVARLNEQIADVDDQLQEIGNDFEVAASEFRSIASNELRNRFDEVRQSDAINAFLSDLDTLYSRRTMPRALADTNQNTRNA